MNEEDRVMSASITPRLYSSKKVALEDRIPLPTPFSVHIDVCSACNFKCSFCFHADTQAKRDVGLVSRKMPMDLFKKIVDDLKGFDDPIKKIKIGNNGEPMIHGELPQMIDYINKSNVTEIIEIFTNGSYLSPEVNVAMIEAGLDIINVSLEGLSDQRFLEVAGVKVDFNDMIENIAHLYSVRKNCKMYVKIADKTSPLDKDRTDMFVLSDDEREYFYNTFGDICDEIFIEKVAPQWSEVQLEKQNKDDTTGIFGQEIKEYKDICPFTFMYLQYNSNGTVSPCTLDWPNKVIIGDAYKETAKEIWTGGKLRDLRIAMARGEREGINFCNHCSAPMVCVDEDLDPFKDKIFDVLEVSEEEKSGDNQWL